MSGKDTGSRSDFFFGILLGIVLGCMATAVLIQDGYEREIKRLKIQLKECNNKQDGKE